MEWSSFALDVLYIVMIVWMLLVACVTAAYGHVDVALVCLVPAGLSALCIRYRLKVAHYYLGRRR
jgi:multisubunit Na+/H+ antiporter MnhF subunit